MDESTIRRFSSDARILILDIIDEEHATDVGQVTVAWQARQPSMRYAQAHRLPRVVGQLLWQLENLEWVRRHGEQLMVTGLGRKAQALARRAQSGAVNDLGGTNGANAGTASKAAAAPATKPSGRTR